MLPANWLTEVVKVAAFVVLSITVYLVFWPRIRVLLGEKNVDLRSIELSAQHKDPETNADDSATYRGLVLRHVRSAVRDGKTICLFVNDGDSALNLRIEAQGDVDGTIEPGDQLRAGHTGSVTFDIPTMKNDISFTLRYEDERGYVYREQYQVNADERILRREDNESS